MSTKVRIPADTTPRFPPQCVCCLEPPVERRQATWSLGGEFSSYSGTVTLSGIPYCRAHADKHDEWLAWSSQRREQRLERASTRTKATAELRKSGPFADLDLSPWQRPVLEGGPVLIAALIGSFIDPDPRLVDLGALGGLLAGVLLMFIVFGVVRARRVRGAMSDIAQPERPTQAAGPKLTHFVPALGLNLTAKVDSGMMQDLNNPQLARGYANVRAYVLHFDNDEYGRLFEAANAESAPPQPTGVGSELLDAIRSANVISVGESGTQAMSGAELADRLMGQTAPCLRCGTTIRFQEGGLLAMDRGIRDQVIMCGNCKAVYEIDLNPRGMTLTADVTARYAGAEPEPAAAPAAAPAAPALPPPDVESISDIDELIRLAIEDPDGGRRLAALEKFIAGTEPVEVMALSRICAMAFDPAIRTRAIERLRERGNEARARFIVQGELNETNPGEKWFGELTDDQRAWAHQSVLELGP